MEGDGQAAAFLIYFLFATHHGSAIHAPALYSFQLPVCRGAGREGSDAVRIGVRPVPRHLSRPLEGRAAFINRMSYIQSNDGGGLLEGDEVEPHASGHPSAGTQAHHWARWAGIIRL
jgi:hypothetical protein